MSATARKQTLIDALSRLETLEERTRVLTLHNAELIGKLELKTREAGSLYAEIDRLHAALAGKWIPVAEQVPDTIEPVLGVNEAAPDIQLCIFQDGVFTANGNAVEVTHWQPVIFAQWRWRAAQEQFESQIDRIYLALANGAQAGVNTILTPDQARALLSRLAEAVRTANWIAALGGMDGIIRQLGDTEKSG